MTKLLLTYSALFPKNLKPSKILKSSKKKRGGGLSFTVILGKVPELNFIEFNRLHHIPKPFAFWMGNAVFQLVRPRQYVLLWGQEWSWYKAWEWGKTDFQKKAKNQLENKREMEFWSPPPKQTSMVGWNTLPLRPLLTLKLPLETFILLDLPKSHS